MSVGSKKRLTVQFDTFINCNWVVTRWQYTFTHNNTQNNTKNNQTTQIKTTVEECGPCPVFARFTLAFALQLRKKHGKTSVRVRKTAVRVQYTYYQNTHTHKHTHTHTHTHITKRIHTHTHTHITKRLHTHIHTHITKQYKTTTVQVKTNTVQYIPKWNSHNIIKCPQYKVTLMYIAPFPARIWHTWGCAIAQAVSRLPLTAEDQVRP
jgi:hypothetical protein